MCNGGRTGKDSKYNESHNDEEHEKKHSHNILLLLLMCH